MSFSIRWMAGIAMLVAIAVSRAGFADQPDAKAVETKLAKTKAKATKSDEQPADALKPAKVDAAAEKTAKTEAEAAATQKAVADLEAVTASLRILFGGGAVIDEENVVEIEMEEVAVNANNDAMDQRFIQQYRPVLKAELGFVRLVCSDLTPEQRPKIREPAEAAMKQAAQQMAKRQNQMQRGLGVQGNVSDPGKLIRDAVAKALKETLSEEQMARYTEAATRRVATRKRAAILSLVSRLDGQLYLSPEQRDKITDSLSSKWQDRWEKWLTVMTMYGNQYFPTIPDECLTAHLSAEQKTVWAGLQKTDFDGWWVGGRNLQNLDNDGWWGDEPVNKDIRINGAAIINQVFGF